MPCRIIILTGRYFENNYLTILTISSSRCLGQQPASQYGSDWGPGGSVREGSLQSQGQVRQAFLRDGLQQGILQQRQLCPRPCRTWTDSGYLRHRHGTGQWGGGCGFSQTESIGNMLSAACTGAPGKYDLAWLSWLETLEWLNSTLNLVWSYYLITVKHHLPFPCLFTDTFNEIMPTSDFPLCSGSPLSACIPHSWAEFWFNFLFQCGMSTGGNSDSYGAPTPQGSYIENTVIVQYDPLLQEVWDQARKIRCTWWVAEQTAGSEFTFIPSEINYSFCRIDLYLWREEWRVSYLYFCHQTWVAHSTLSDCWSEIDFIEVIITNKMLNGTILAYSDSLIQIYFP